MAHDEWIVIHKDYNDNIIDEFRPMNTTFTKRHKDSGDISYDISLSERTMRWAIVGPKRTRFELWNSDYGELPIMSGIHSYINTKRGEEVLHVQGKSWLWYLQNRHYPFDGLNPNDYLAGTAANDQGLAYQQFAEPEQIINELWTVIFSRPNSDFGMSLFTIPLGYEVPFRVELADTRTMFDFLTELSEIEPGFDFFDTPDRVVSMSADDIYLDTARLDPSFCAWVFDRYKPPTDIVEIEFENNGPEGTHIMGLGAGTSARIVRSYGYDQSQEQFGRWDMTAEFPDTLTESRLVGLTQAYFSKGLYPLHNIPMRVKPDNIPNFWTRIVPGQAIWIKENFESNHADGASVITEMQATIDNQGDAVVDLTLEEINAHGRPGTQQA
jgi:hypothetical protein